VVDRINRESTVVLRAAIREDFASKLGKLKHSIGTYDRLIRATVPVIVEGNLQAKFFRLMSFDIGTDVKAIIENELLPYIDNNLKFFNFLLFRDNTSP
jgi:hypothetical protein